MRQPKSNIFEWGHLLYLWWGNFNVDNDGCEGGFGELCRMVDGIRVQNHQLQGFGELKYPLNLTLNLRCADKTERILLKLVSSLYQKSSGIFILRLAQSPRLERVLDLSIMGLLLRTDLLARDRSAVTRVIEILRTVTNIERKNMQWNRLIRFIKGLTFHDFGDYSVISPFYILLTFPQICVSGSQKELSASYPSPGWKGKKKETCLNKSSKEIVFLCQDTRTTRHKNSFFPHTIASLLLSKVGLSSLYYCIYTCIKRWIEQPKNVLQ